MPIVRCYCEECMRDSDRRRNGNTTIGAYEFGAYETYKRVVSDLERWIV